MPALRGLLIGRAGRGLLFHFERNMFFRMTEAVSYSSRGALIGRRRICRKGLIMYEPAAHC